MLVFFDVILVYIRTCKEHLGHLDHILRILHEQRFYAKLSKCEFGMIEILYLGHIISHERVRVDEQKIAII